MYRKKGIWKNLVPTNHSWKRKVLPYLLEATSKCKNSFVEKKDHSICWHYRNADIQDGMLHAEYLATILDTFIVSNKLKVLKGKCVLEITSGMANKGLATKHLLQNCLYDMVLAIGDDATDEVMFMALSVEEHHLSVKVGEGSSKARYRIASVKETWDLLKSIAS